MTNNEKEDGVTCIDLALPKEYADAIRAAAAQNGDTVDAYIEKVLREGLERLDAESDRTTEQE